MNGEIVLTDWKVMTFTERKRELGEQWRGFQRRTRNELYDIALGLRAHRDEMQRGEWYPFLESIEMPAKTGERLLAFSRCEPDKLSDYSSMHDFLKALPPKKPKEVESSTPPAQPAESPVEKPAPRDEDDDYDAEAAAEDAAREAEAEQAEDEREKRDEKLSILLADTDGDAVETLVKKLDAADARHRADVDALTKAKSDANRAKRRERDICNALLKATPSTALNVVDDALLQFFGVARK